MTSSVVACDGSRRHGRWKRIHVPCSAESTSPGDFVQCSEIALFHHRKEQGDPAINSCATRMRCPSVQRLPKVGRSVSCNLVNRFHNSLLPFRVCPERHQFSNCKFGQLGKIAPVGLVSFQLNRSNAALENFKKRTINKIKILTINTANQKTSLRNTNNKKLVLTVVEREDTLKSIHQRDIICRLHQRSSCAKAGDKHARVALYD